jgi:hypothetical protein
MSADSDDWLEDVIVVNESKDQRVAGDVSAFRGPGDACRYLEPWWVADNEGFALNGLGQQVTFGVCENSVVIERCEPMTGGVQILLDWLRATALHVHEARTSRAQKGKLVLGRLEASGVLPQSIEGLIAYIGFSK